MGLKPITYLHFTNPFTEVNGNNSYSILNLLPSALADGFRTPDKKGFCHIFDFINQ